jgi:hypothetical protein
MVIVEPVKKLIERLDLSGGKAGGRASPRQKAQSAAW